MAPISITTIRMFPDIDRVCFALQSSRKRSSSPIRDGMNYHGIGRENAERRLAFSFSPPRRVATRAHCGFAGGLNPYLTTGTVVFFRDEERD